MENVISVNIGGVSFTLNAEAYAILDKYLKELTNHYKTKAYGAEIMEDIESRIAELLLEKYTKDEVVNSERIEEVIAIMGKPSDYYSDDEEEAKPSEGEKNNFHRDSFSNSYAPGNKKLHRDLQNKYIGGVFGGLGHFFNTDPTWLRLTFVGILLLLKFADNFTFNFGVFETLFHILIVAYIVLWICVPGAKTYTQKCEMMGHDPGVKGAEGVRRSESFNAQGNPSPLENLFRWMLGLLMIFIGFGIFLYGLFIGVFVCIGIVPAVLEDWTLTSTFTEFMPLMSGWGLSLFLVSCVLIWLIPAILLIYEGIRIIGKFKAPKWHPGLILFIIWLLSVIAFAISLFYIAKDLESKDVDIKQVLDEKYEVIVDSTSSEDYDNAYIIDADSVIVDTQGIIPADSSKVK